MDKYLEQTNLKRTRHTFQTTAISSMQSARTAAKDNHYHTFSYKDKFLSLDHISNVRPVEQKINQKKMVDLKPKISQLVVKIIQDEQKMRKETGSKFVRHFYYQAICKAAKHPLLGVPDVVFDLYAVEQRKRTKASNPPVAYCQGYLPSINCAYYAVENTIVFISIEDIMNSNGGVLDPCAIHEVKSQVISIIELSNINKSFLTPDNLLMVHYPWQIEYFSWQPQLESNQQQGHEKAILKKCLKPLNIIYKLPVQKMNPTVLIEKGCLYFFDQNGALHQNSICEQSKLKLFKNNKLNIKNYVVHSKNTIEILNRNEGKFSVLVNLANGISQVAKQLLLPFTIQTQILFCDNQRQLLFGMLSKSIFKPFGAEKQIIIVCYSIKNRPTFLHSFSQDFLLTKHLSHYGSNVNMTNFLIETISPAPSSYDRANLLIATKSGIRIIMEITKGDAKIVQIIRPPDLCIFDDHFKRSINILQLSPIENNCYKMHSFLQDNNTTFCTLSNQKSNVVTFVTGLSFSTGYDINLQVCPVDLDIYREGSWKVKIHSIRFQLNNGTNKKTSQLSSQTIMAPKIYLFQNDSKLQLVSYLRPIDLLFTALQLKCSQFTDSISRKLYSSSSKQKLIFDIFVSQSNQPSLVCTCPISIEELCSMLLQIIVDKSGNYHYCSSAAAEMAQIWISMQHSQDNSAASNSYKPINKMPYQSQLNSKLKRSRLGSNHLYSYKEIPPQIIEQARRLFDTYLQQWRLKILSNTVEDEIKGVELQSSVFMKYLSQILKALWNKKIVDINKRLLLVYLQKVDHLFEYTSSNQHKLILYSDQTRNRHAQKEREDLILLIRRVRELMVLIQSVPILPQNATFADCLTGIQQLQEYLFKSIHRQFQCRIIKKWRQLFPNFVSHDFTKVVLLYGEIEQKSNNDQIIISINNQTSVNELPEYFIWYLRQIRKLSTDQIKGIKKKIKWTDPNQINNEKRQQLVIDSKFILLVGRNANSTQISASDLQIILDTLLDRNNNQKMNVANKQNLLLFLRKSGVESSKLQYIAKCLSVQYELFRYYERALKKEQNTQSWLNFKVSENKKIKQDGQTIELLQYNTISDHEKLKKLVWITADYWMMADYCVVFDDPQLPIILKKICENFKGSEGNRFRRLSDYLERYLLNLAIKSNFKVEVLEIICRVIDEYMQIQPQTRRRVQEWFKFNTATITNQIIWLPNLLIKMGYDPSAILAVQKEQLSQKFNKYCSLDNQIQYGLKFLICYTLVDLYQCAQANQFVQMTNYHINQLQKNGAVDEKTGVGLKKMLSLLGSKIK